MSDDSDYEIILNLYNIWSSKELTAEQAKELRVYRDKYMKDDLGSKSKELFQNSTPYFTYGLMSAKELEDLIRIQLFDDVYADIRNEVEEELEPYVKKAPWYDPPLLPHYLYDKYRKRSASSKLRCWD